MSDANDKGRGAVRKNKKARPKKFDLALDGNHPQMGLFRVAARGARRRLGGHRLFLLRACAEAQSAGQNGHEHDCF